MNSIDTLRKNELERILDGYDTFLKEKAEELNNKELHRVVARVNYYQVQYYELMGKHYNPSINTS